MQNYPPKNAFAFQFKRKYVLSKTQVRFNQNAEAFDSKRTCVLNRSSKAFKCLPKPSKVYISNHIKRGPADIPGWYYSFMHIA